jgi:hypothetical protein
VADAQRLPATLFDPESKCTLSVTLPVSIFRTLSGSKLDQLSVTSEAILPNHQWTGSDSQHSRFDGVTVLGSFIQSDADTGAISLRLKRGDRLLYRSGPTGGRKFIRLNNKDSLRTLLPVSLDWQILEFSNPVLSAEFVISLSDEGSGCGEWSAVALKIE